ncbi:MAG: hypothetical protein U0S48_22395, partial [Solirubrobacteraceae bacterium]
MLSVSTSNVSATAQRAPLGHRGGFAINDRSKLESDIAKPSDPGRQPGSLGGGADPFGALT